MLNESRRDDHAPSWSGEDEGLIAGSTAVSTRESELEAMRIVSEALSKLSTEGAFRVLRWYADTLGASSFRALGSLPGVQVQSSDQKFETAAEVFEAANPSTGAERALVIGYWFQVTEGHEDFDSQRINTELKNLGFAASNITADFTKLMNRSPRLVQQTRKEGRTNQARKRYKLTREGVKAVEAMFA